VVEEIRKHLGGRYFNTVIRHSVKLAEAASHALPIAGYCHRSAGFEDYEALAEEVLEMEAEWPPKAAVRPTAPTMTLDGVFFALEAPDARRVQLVGDFNGWAIDGGDMRPAGAVWTRVLKLQPGRYRYRYVIDGHWRSDPLNRNVEPSPFGEDNSVLVVTDNVLPEPRRGN
jgi:hypothetical protein